LTSCNLYGITRGNKDKIEKSDKLKLKAAPKDDVLSAFYDAIADGDVTSLSKMHIPRSDVFYVREKYHTDTGNWVSLDRMERAMFLEGHLKSEDVYKPNQKREWES